MRRGTKGKEELMEKLKPRTTLRAVFAVALGLASCALAETETVGGYTWSYRAIGTDAVEIWEEDKFSFEEYNLLREVFVYGKRI